MGPGKPRGRRRGNGKSFGGLGGRGLSALLVIVGPFLHSSSFHGRYSRSCNGDSGWPCRRARLRRRRRNRYRSRRILDDAFSKNISLQLMQLLLLKPVDIVLFIRSRSSERNSGVFIAVTLFLQMIRFLLQSWML